MDGVFFKRNNLFPGLLLGLAAAFLAMPVMKGQTIQPVRWGITPIIGLIAYGIMMFNNGAFLKIKGGHISARFHWFGRLECDISDIRFVDAMVNSLLIETENQKAIIMGLVNPLELYEYIRREMPVVTPQFKRQELISKQRMLQQKHKNQLILLCALCILLFANIFIVVALTGQRDLTDFSQQDWIITGVFGGLELIVLVATFILASSCGKKPSQINKLGDKIRTATILTEPLLPGNIHAVYATSDYFYRFTIFHLPNTGDFYYTAQFLQDGENFVEKYTSGFSQDPDTLLDDIRKQRDLIDISHYFESDDT